MTVASTTNRKSFSGDGVTTSFGTSPVVFYESTDLVVQVFSTAGVATTLTEGTQYTVSGGSSTGATGTVNLAGGFAPYGAPAVGTTLLIRRILPLRQDADFVNGNINDAEVSETALDKLTMIAQQISETSGRGVAIPAVETASDALTVLPFDRASKFLAFDANKEMIASSGTPGAVPVSSFMETLLDDTSAADGRTTLGAVGLTGNETVGGVKTFSSKPILPVTTPSGNEATSATYVQSLLPALRPEFGVILSNNASDATNDIDFTAGARWNSTRVSRANIDARTKLLDANWSPGTGNGMRYSGAAISDTTYNIFMVWKANGADADFYAYPGATEATVLAALQAETGGADYIYLRYVGSIVRASGAIRGFVQNKNIFNYKASIFDVNANNPGTAAVTRTLSLPLNVVVEAIVNAGYTNSGTGVSGGLYLSSLAVNDEAPSATAAPLWGNGALGSNGAGGAAQSFTQQRVFTNTSAQIRSRVSGSDANVHVRIATLGWIDHNL